MFHYTVEQIEALVVISLGCDEFLEHSKKTRLEGRERKKKKLNTLHERFTALWALV